VLHHEEAATAGAVDAKVQDGHDPRVIEASRDLSLALKAGLVDLVRALGQELEGKVPLESWDLRQVDRGEGASPELGVNLVAPDPMPLATAGPAQRASTRAALNATRARLLTDPP